MRVLVTGSAGHLGEALVRSLRSGPHEVRGLDHRASPHTDHVGSLLDARFTRACLRGVDVVLHTATLHKPHLASHSRRAFVDTNVNGTLNVLEAALACGASGVVYTSTTSVFGAAARPAPDEPAAWITEDVTPTPRNIYGASKLAAESLCELFHRAHGLACLVLRTSRFFPEPDDRRELREAYDDRNLKANELLYRRVDLADAVEAHLRAIEQLARRSFGRYIVSATTPFAPEHREQLRRDAPGLVRSLFPDYEDLYARRGWRMFPAIERVYVNRRAREELGWRPRYDFRRALEGLARDGEISSSLARAVGSKGYHDVGFAAGAPYPVLPED